MVVWVLFSGGLDKRGTQEEIPPRWQENSPSWGAAGHHGRQKGANRESG